MSFASLYARTKIVLHRDQITLTKFLGSGAFGEVFEGVARGLQTGDTKVAIKVRNSSVFEDFGLTIKLF